MTGTWFVILVIAALVLCGAVEHYTRRGKI